MQAHKTTLPNGLRVLTVPMPALESVTVMVWVGVGSRYEQSEIAGISHFLEHMVFKGGAKYPTAKVISETLDAMGAEFNASTSKEFTNFYIKVRAGLLEKAFDVLSDMTLAPLLKDEDINLERGVIVSEMNMYEDTPMYKVSDVFDQVVFEGNTLGVDIIGTKETIASVDNKHFVSFREQYYRPDNMLIVVAGGTTEEEVSDITNKYFGKIPQSPYERKYSSFVPSQSSFRAKVIKRPIEQAHFVVGFLGNKLGDERRFIEEVLCVILGGGMSSRLFTEVREKRGLAYTVRTSNDNFLDTGAIGTYAGVEPKKAIEALKVILDEHRTLAAGTSTIADEELVKAKEYVKGHLALSLESTNSVSSFFAHDELLLGKMETPDEVFAGIDKVSRDEVVALAKEKFQTSQLNLAVIGPFEDSKEFEKVLQSQ